MEKETFLILCEHFWPDLYPEYQDELWQMLQEVEAGGHDPHEVIEGWHFATLRAALQRLRNTAEQDAVIIEAIRSQPLRTNLEYMKTLNPQELEEYTQGMRVLMDMQKAGQLSEWLQEMGKQ